MRVARQGMDQPIRQSWEPQNGAICGDDLMSEARDMFALLRQSADAKAVDAIERLVADAPDHHLCRINALALAASEGIDEEVMVAVFLHAARIGMFDMSWNVLCPGCGGVLDSNATLKTVQKDEYVCALCADSYAPTLDEMVEVTFTVSPRVRKIAAHTPNELPFSEYYRQMYWGSGVDVPDENYEAMVDDFVIDHVDLASGEKAVLSVQLPAEFIIVFEPVTHSAQFIDVKGEPTRERQNLSLTYDREHTHNQTMEMRPGPLRLALDNRTDTRVLPSVIIASTTLHNLLHNRRPFLTAKRLLSNQTFRDLYRTDTLDVGQRLKITSLTFLFTDLRGSTELYERVGDLVAFDLVQAHFQVLQRDRRVRGRGSRQDHRRRRHGDVPDAGSGDRRGAAHARRDAAAQRAPWARGLAPEDRRARRPLHRGGDERTPGLLRPDGQHRLARAGSRQFAVDLCHRRGRGRRQDRRPAAAQSADAAIAKRVAARYRAGSRGLRDPVASGIHHRGMTEIGLLRALVKTTLPCGGRTSANTTSMKVAVTRTSAKPPIKLAFGLKTSRSPTR